MISFAAGEWGKAWPMSTLLSLSGSYIIRRNEPLPLYRKILAIHLRELVKVKMPQGIFLEGGLTRDGTINSVKLGLMSYILSAYGEQNVDDIVFIPVAFNYDQVPEDKTLLKNQDKGFEGRSKLYTVFSTLLSLAVVVYQKFKRGKTAYGHAAVSFGEPLSTADWLQQQGINPQSLSPQQKREIVSPIAGGLVESIKAEIPVLPVSVVATVFASNPEAALSESEVQQKSALLIQAFREQEAILIFDETETARAIAEGLQVLKTRKVLTLEQGRYSINEDNRPLLNYLYNSTKHLLGTNF